MIRPATFLILLLIPLSAGAQAPASQDSTVVATAAVLATLDTFGIAADSSRIWLEVGNHNDPISESAEAFLGQILIVLQEKFPGARPAQPRPNLFQCPPGVQVSMPGRGCPILDNGVILRVGNFVWSSNSVSVSVSLTRTEGRSTWMTGHVMIFERNHGGWKLARLGARFMT